MAEEADKTVSLTKGDDKAPPIVYGETGYSGLVTLGGQVWDDCQHELRWPFAYKTFRMMSTDGTIGPALEFVEGKVAEANWKVRIPKGVPKDREDTLKAQQKYLTEVMDDMRHSWTTAIKNAATFNRYGFSVLEMVFRFRNTKYGSKFNDGLVGVEALSPRSQGTIVEWYWKNKGREIDGFDQRVVIPTNESMVMHDGWEILRVRNNTETAVKFIPYKKCLHFRHNPQNDSPSGTSPLVAAWQPWKMKQAYQESEAIGVAQDNNAFKILFLPPDYLVEDADEDRKASFEMYKRMMEKAHQAKQSGFILPMLLDQEGNKMFDFEIKNISGTKSYDVNAIINRYVREIQVALFADVLSLGGGSGGSYSLAESKVSIIDMAVKSRLNEIKDQLNHKLVKTLFEQNSWPTDIVPYFDFDLPNSETLDNKGKYYQRTKAVGLLPIVPQVVNQVLSDAGIDYQVPEDMSTEDLMKLLQPVGEQMQSESGGGMEKGMPNSNGKGTGEKGDSSVANNANT
ncbi:MAG: portal protein [Caudoviricetes sp.]|nr:MAG: portal protein [Caudoviricetes sp.]